MQRMIALLAFGMLSLPAYARDGLYFSYSAGAGISNVKQNYFIVDQNGHSPATEGVFSYNLQLGLGYQYKKWRLETGLQYAVTGYKLSGITLGSNYPNSSVGTSETLFNHLSLPLRLGYTIKLSDRLSLVPYAGIMVGYNFGARTTTDLPGEPQSDYRWQSEDFKDRYQSVSVWGNLALQLEYKVSNRVTLFGGPSAQYMISNFAKVPSNAVYKASDRPFLLNMNIGAKMTLK